jgi:hypothetical protein
MIAGALERLSLAQLIEEWNRCTRSVEHARDIGQSNPEDEAALPILVRASSGWTSGGVPVAPGKTFITKSKLAAFLGRDIGGRGCWRRTQ